MLNICDSTCFFSNLLGHNSMSFQYEPFFGEVGMTWKPIQGLNGHFSYAGPSNNLLHILEFWKPSTIIYYSKPQRLHKTEGFLQETESHSGYNL